MNWFILSIFSVFTLSLFLLTTKKLLSQKNADPRIFGGLMQLSVGLIALPVAIIDGFTIDMSIKTLGLLFLTGLVYTVSATLYYTGLQKTELSVSVILESLGIFWALLFGALFLSEILVPEKAIAAVLVFLAIVIVSWVKTQIRITRSQWLILAATICYTFGAVLDKYLTGFARPTTYLSLSFLFAGTLMTVINIPRIRSVGVSMFSKMKNRMLFAASVVLVFFSYWAVFTAYTIGGDVSVIYPITHTQTVLVPILGILFLGERKNLKKKLVAVLLTLSAYLLIRP